MPTKGKVTANELNFRSSPTTSTKQNIIKKLAKGTSLEILEVKGEWLKVTVNGQTGFVSSNFVQLEQEAPKPPTNTTITQPASPNPVTGIFKFVGNKAVAPDGTQFANKFKLGVFNFGVTSINDFVKAQPALFANLAPSQIKIMQAVSANEGKLEAINTWDNAFLTFGIFQWTVGTDSGAGELPSMINLLKQKSPSSFQKYFGQFGLDTTGITDKPEILPTGFFSLNGVRLKSPAQKAKLRTLEWAYRFWLSGHDDNVRQTQIEHAVKRVDLFYRSSKAMIRNRFVADYVNSEFGVALILDQHVNRPGHVPGTLSRAVDKFVAQIGTDKPETWTDAEEKKLLNIYIELRAGTSMTDSTKRANVIRKAVTDGLASDKRGSYKV